MISPSIAMIALWLIWLLGWLLGALTAGKSVVVESRISTLSYSVFIWAGLILLFAHLKPIAAIQRPILPGAEWRGWLGVCLTAAGLLYSAWARLHLGRMWSKVAVLKADHRLVKTGPYALTRHPIYTGLLLAVVGSSLVQGTVAGFISIALFTVGFWLKLRKEEALLIGHFGNAYSAYQTSVPALVPRLRCRQPSNK